MKASINSFPIICCRKLLTPSHSRAAQGALRLRWARTPGRRVRVVTTSPQSASVTAAADTPWSARCRSLRTNSRKAGPRCARLWPNYKAIDNDQELRRLLGTTFAGIMSSTTTTNIESVMHEARVFPPPKSFAEHAHVKSMAELEALRAEASADPEKFWSRFAESELHWFKKWDTVLKWEAPHAQWFAGGKINISYNCLDRHLATWRRNKAALIWEGEPGDTRTLTYQQLHTEVCRFANVLKQMGIRKGDRVALYMPLIPELAISMLACARIGATHSVVFGGFSSTALIDRINDAQCKVVVTADGGWRRGNEVKLKAAVDEALKETPSVQSCIVVKRTGGRIHMEAGRDHWWHELSAAVNADCPAEELDSEHPLFILYTSGTTGKPKGILHTTAGYLLQAHLTTKWIFDIRT